MSRTITPVLAAKLEAERRLKEGISGHRTGLPKKLLDLFAAPEAPDVLTEIKKKKIKLPYTGIAQYVAQFAEPEDPEYEPAMPETVPSSPRLLANPELRSQARIEEETIWERRQRVAQEKVAQGKEQIREGETEWDPSKDPSANGDAFKTLFVSRLSYEVTEKKLRREFEEFGPIRSIRIVHDKNNGKSRGYAFIEYEHKNDMKLAYKQADGKKIEGKRVSVDVERGRTVPTWKPRRLGGGKGGETREKKSGKKKKLPVAVQAILSAAPIETQAAENADRPKDDGAEDREREREREKDKERERARDKDRERDRDRDRDRDRARSRDMVPKEEEDLSRVPPPGTAVKRDDVRDDRHASREHRSDRHRDRDRERDRDRDRDRDRKRDRSDRDGERHRSRDRHDEGRSSKRQRDDKDRSRRRERDMV